MQRTSDPDGARHAIVRLTPEGSEQIEQMIVDHVANEHQLLAGLPEDEIARLDGLLRKLANSIGI